MAASHTLPHSFVNPQISKLGVLTLYGYGVRVTMQAGHLQIEDGIGPERRRFRLPRVNHRLKRLVCIGEDGFVTLAALTWLTDVGASFVMLNRYGKVRMVTGPASPSESKLRRSQALALGNGKAVELSRQLISAKLSGQEALVRGKLKKPNAADSIVRRVATGSGSDRNPTSWNSRFPSLISQLVGFHRNASWGPAKVNETLRYSYHNEYLR